MPASYPNFYQNLQECEKRINQTVVLYDGVPHFVLCLANHQDGIIRVYLAPYDEQGMVHERTSVPYGWHDEPGMTRQQKMDNWMEAHPGLVIRKTMNSPHFNRFRPFPLGMCNFGGECYYVERNPVRHTQQGLIQDALSMRIVELVPSNVPYRGLTKRRNISITDYSMYDCIMGNYPSAEECLKNLNDPAVTNNAVGFHRDFALLRGPMEVMYLAYRNDVVALLPHGDFGLCRLGKDFRHLKEAVTELSVFTDIR